MLPSFNITPKVLIVVGAIGATIGVMSLLYNSTIFPGEGEPLTDPSDPIVEQLPEREIELPPVDIPLPGDPPTSLGGSVWLDFSLDINQTESTANMTWKANESFYLVIGDLSKSADSKNKFPVVWDQEGFVVYQIVYLEPDNPCFGTSIVKFKVQYNITGEFNGFPFCTFELNVTSKLLEVAEFMTSCPWDWKSESRLAFSPLNEVLKFDPYLDKPITLIKTELYTFGIRGLTVPPNAAAACTK
jgi:hypothetical protein